MLPRKNTAYKLKGKDQCGLSNDEEDPAGAAALVGSFKRYKNWFFMNFFREEEESWKVGKAAADNGCEIAQILLLWSDSAWQRVNVCVKRWSAWDS